VIIRLKRYIEKMFFKNIDLVITNGEFLKKHVDSIYNVDSKILYPVLDDDFIYNKILSKLEKNIMFTYSRWET
jgi:hypothetical protein